VQRFSSQPPQLVFGSNDPTDAATPAKKNSGMIWKTQVSAWKITDVVSRLPHMNTSSAMMLVAITAWPATTPTSDTILMTSMARSRSAGVLASMSAALGKVSGMVRI
jgi:hypothetical protein